METTNEKTPETLFYYCSLDTFVNIINNKSIWLTEIGKSNDSLEQKYLATEIIYNLDKYIKFRCKHSINNQEIENLQNEFYTKIRANRFNPVWGICFSEKQDDLSQWRGYADDAKGMCIGFSTEYLDTINKLSDINSSAQINDCFRFRKVEYGNEAIKNYLNFLSNLPPITDSMRLRKTLERDLNGTYVRLYYKHEAFKSEAEWRMVYTKITCEDNYKFNFTYLNDLLTQSKKFKINGKSYEARKGYLQSHIELKIIDLLSAMNVIYIGPKSKLTIEDLEDFLSFHFGKDKIDKFPNLEYSSAFSYR